jgi:hypothetical protein
MNEDVQTRAGRVLVGWLRCLLLTAWQGLMKMTHAAAGCSPVAPGRSRQAGLDMIWVLCFLALWKPAADASARSSIDVVGAAGRVKERGTGRVILVPTVHVRT